MLRIIPDPGVLISSLISGKGAPREILERWQGGEVQFVCSPMLVDELVSVGNRERFRQWFEVSELDQIERVIVDAAEMHPDADHRDTQVPDVKDAYLVSLARQCRVDALITGDSALLRYDSDVRITTPRALLRVLDDLGSTFS